MTARRFLFIGLSLILVSIGIGGSFAQDHGENAAVAEGRYALTAAIQAGRHVAWRVDSSDGRVSLCTRTRKGQIACSDWSEPALSGLGPYAINAEFSQIADSSWVWRINTRVGQIAMCSFQLSRSEISDVRPICESLEGQE